MRRARGAGCRLARDEGQRRAAVTTAAVQRVPSLQSLVTASGEIVAARYADIGANLMGRLVALTVKEGDRVTAGQVLARIDPIQAGATADAAQAAVAVLEAEAAPRRPPTRGAGGAGGGPIARH